MLKQYAAAIADDFANGLSLEIVLEKYNFEKTSDLGEWMCRQGYRWDVVSHRYVEDSSIRKEEFMFEQLATHQRLNDQQLFDSLEAQLASMKKLLQGAFPVRLSGSVRQELLYYCEAHSYQVDDFIEQSIIEKMKREGR